MPVADGVSPSAGKDVNGPTAAANSVSRLDHFIASNGTLFNQKFHPSALSGREGLEKFVGLIQSYFDQKGSHMQFNVVSRETLLDAQEHPEQYKHLVVRVAGYSALFTTLSKSLQDDIIRRTEQGLEEYLKTKGRIFDIQRYSIHDGNGIRTIVFLKGCVLRCRWCCNPESQHYEIETMMVQGEPKVIGEDTTVAEVMKTVEKDRTYYRRTGGGLTLSGGESLCQPKFARDLLRAAKESGITTAMESMGCAPYSTIEEILPYLDQYLLDIKHMNPEKHKEFTGRSNELMLENAKKIADSHMTELSIRVPVIPGFNDTEIEIRDIAEYVRKLGNVRRMHLLPYHRLGQDKYDGLNRPYLMGDVKPPTNEKMGRLLKVAEEVSGVECRIGG